MSPTIPPVGRSRYEQEQQMMAGGGQVRLVDPNQQLQFANVQQWQADQSLNSPPSNGPEQQRPRAANRASSSATSSDSSLALWNSTEDLRLLSQQHAMEVQSPMGDADGWSPQWSAMTGDPTMMQQTFNGTPFDPPFPGLHEGPHYSPAVPAIAEDGFFQDGLVLNGQTQSPKLFGPVNGMGVSPPAGIQNQQVVWGPQALQASMGLQQ